MRGMKKRSARDECLRGQDRKKSAVPMRRLDDNKDMKEVLEDHDTGRCG